MNEDDETDAERQGVDGLKLLASGGLPKEVKEKSTVSDALVPLLPAQKRPRALSREIGDNEQPSGIQKVEGNVQAGRSKPWGMLRRDSGQQGRDIQERRSAPHKGSDLLERELRSCHSAPNLALPAIKATVRGLQDGTIQVDRQTRLQIASAAKRVLEAREAKKRMSQERDTHPVSPHGVQESVPAPATPKSSKPALVHGEIVRPEIGPTLSNADQVARAPTSLPTAAALARGESLPLGGSVPLTRVASDAAVQFHRPAALGTARMGSSLITSPHKHTVTTGLPKFSEGSRGASAGSRGEGAPTLSLPRQPLLPCSGGSGSMQRVPSKTLTVSDLFKQEGPLSKVQD